MGCYDADQVPDECVGLKGRPCRNRKKCEWKNRACVAKAEENDGDEESESGPMSECDGLKGKPCRNRKACAWRDRTCVPKGEQPEPVEGDEDGCHKFTKGFTC